MTYQVLITDRALAKLREQVHYIGVECQAPQNAERWLARVLEAADSLADMPRRCPKAIESALRPYEIRSLNIDGYLLLFTIDDAERLVVVIGARHGRQMPQAEELPEHRPATPD
jgi:plasmid stabilization system protein ParE